MPTINLTQIALIAAKIILVTILFAIMVSYMGEFQSLISVILSKIFGGFGEHGSLNLGYVAGAIGLSSFLNLLVASLYSAGSLYISGMVGIIIFKYSIKVYQTIINF